MNGSWVGLIGLQAIHVSALTIGLIIMTGVFPGKIKTRFGCPELKANWPILNCFLAAGLANCYMLLYRSESYRFPCV
jgi:hypothetical protein